MNDFLTIQSPGPNPAETTQPIAMNGSGNKSGSDVFGLLFQEKASINLEDNKIAGLRAEANDHDSAAPVEEDKSIKGIIRFRLHRQQGIDFLKSPLKEPERKGKQGITFLISPFKEPEPQGKNPEVNIKPPAGHPSEIDESIKGIKRSRPNIQQGLTFLKFPFKGPRLEGKNPTVKIKPPAGHPKDKRIKGLRAEADNDSAMPNETEDSIQGIKR
ncbi:MAG: hypothetical protein ACE5IR_17045, partial [bacterium]